MNVGSQIKAVMVRSSDGEEPGGKNQKCDLSLRHSEKSLREGDIWAGFWRISGTFQVEGSGSAEGWLEATKAQEAWPGGQWMQRSKTSCPLLSFRPWSDPDIGNN